MTVDSVFKAMPEEFDPVEPGIQIENLASRHPESVGFLTKRGIRCIRCGEPIWGTLGDLLDEEGVADPQKLIVDLNEFLQSLQ